MAISRAIVLAAGEGTRLQPLTHNRPKPMLPVGNRPILEYVLDALVEAGIKQLHIVVGYRSERVQAHVGPTYRGRPVTYHHQEKQLGSGHALLQATDVLDEDVLVANGDQVVDNRLVEQVIETHDSEAVGTLALVDSEAVDLYGGVAVENGQVVDLVDAAATDRTHLLNAGVYAFDPKIVETIEAVDPVREERSLLSAIQRCVDDDKLVRGVVSDALWADATYPWDVLSVSRELFTGGTIARSGHAIHDTARVDTEASITEPVAIGPDVEVGPNASIGPYASIGENVSIGPGAVVENSVVDDDTRVGANATVIDCVTGQGVLIGPGSVVLGGPGDVQVGSRVFENKPLGALLADRAAATGGVTFTPGTLVGSGATLHPGTTVDGTIAAGAEVTR